MSNERTRAPKAAQTWVREHQNGWIASISPDDQGFYIAFLRRGWDACGSSLRLGAKLDDAKTAADSHVPPHNCRSCPPWRPLGI